MQGGGRIYAPAWRSRVDFAHKGSFPRTPLSREPTGILGFKGCEKMKRTILFFNLFTNTQNVCFYSFN
jgi:hypothetical protein